MSDYLDPACILAALVAAYRFLGWVDFRGTRLAARHPAQPRQRRH